MARRALRQTAWLLGLLLGAGVASAQSAADTATARKLATEGIELHRQGQYAEALDRLQRAQALYDAPVHLLYIARAQAELGQLVEAAETYRRLSRVELAPNAPDAFREAVDAAAGEGKAVEARIAALDIEIKPSGVAGLVVEIDGQRLPPATLGVERPMNPGAHRIAASAPGHKRVEQSLELADAEQRTLVLELVPSAQAGASAGGTASPKDQGVAARDRAGGASSGRPELLVGLRLGGAVPTGTLAKTADSELPMSDYFKPGIGFELYVGGRVARYFGAKLLFEGYAFTPGSKLNDVSDFSYSVDVTNVTNGQGVGLAATVGTESGKWGGFGELGIVFQESVSVDRSFSSDDSTSPCGSSFSHKTVFNGPAFRIGGGAQIPVARMLRLMPFVNVSLAQVMEVQVEGGCEEEEAQTDFVAGEVPAEQRAGHQIFMLGLGGELFFGL